MSTLIRSLCLVAVLLLTMGGRLDAAVVDCIEEQEKCQGASIISSKAGKTRCCYTELLFEIGNVCGGSDIYDSRENKTEEDKVKDRKSTFLKSCICMTGVENCRSAKTRYDSVVDTTLVARCCLEGSLRLVDNQCECVPAEEIAKVAREEKHQQVHELRKKSREEKRAFEEIKRRLEEKTQTGQKDAASGRWEDQERLMEEERVKGSEDMVKLMEVPRKRMEERKGQLRDEEMEKSKKVTKNTHAEEMGMLRGEAMPMSRWDEDRKGRVDETGNNGVQKMKKQRDNDVIMLLGVGLRQNLDGSKRHEVDGKVGRGEEVRKRWEESGMGIDNKELGRRLGAARKRLEERKEQAKAKEMERYKKEVNRGWDDNGRRKAEERRRLYFYEDEGGARQREEWERHRDVEEMKMTERFHMKEI